MIFWGVIFINALFANPCTKTLGGDEKWVNWFHLDQKKVLQEIVLEKLKSDDSYSRHLLEAFLFHWIRDLRRNRRLVTFVFGHSVLKTGYDYKEELEFAKKLADSGSTLIYDADLPTGEILRKTIPSHQLIGVSGQVSNFKSTTTLLISNPYLRMKFFEMAHSTIVTPGSGTATGLILDRAVNHVLILGKNTWKDFKPPKWEKDKIDISAHYSPDIIFTVPKYLREKKKLDKSTSESTIRTTIESLDNVELVEALEYADQMVAMEKRLSQLKPRLNATVFGWSRDHEIFRGLVYDSVKLVAQNGYSIRTGGSLGYMAVANRAAMDAQGVSIGIPYLGLHRLGLEQEVPTHLHTETIGTKGYEIRIGALLKGVDYILIAPGSSGTIQELAVSFIDINFRPTVTNVAFLSTSFYGDFYRWLLKYCLETEEGNLPIYLIQNPEDILLPVRKAEPKEPNESMEGET